jgi:hypothetical protein
MEPYEPLAGFELSGCAVRRWNIIAFWGQRWDNPDPLETRVTRVFYYYADEPDEEKWAYREVGETRGIRGCGTQWPNERWVFVTDDGEVYVSGGGDDAFESPIVPGPYAFFSAVSRIPPGRAYAVGPRRKVYVRDAPDTWRHLSSGLAPDGARGEREPTGFSDVAGFGESVLYACGGPGDLWHYDGQSWRRVDIPTNERLWRVCCASDGVVYVIAGERTVLAGRGDKWQLLEQVESESRLESIVDFNGKVILSTQQALFEIRNGTVLPASLGNMPAMRSCSFLAAGDGILVVAGARCASTFDGKSWSVIIDG